MSIDARFHVGGVFVPSRMSSIHCGFAHLSYVSELIETARISVSISSICYLSAKFFVGVLHGQI